MDVEQQARISDGHPEKVKLKITNNSTPVGHFIKKTQKQGHATPVASLHDQVNTTKQMGVIISSCLHGTTKDLHSDKFRIVGHGGGHGRTGRNIEKSEDQNISGGEGHGSQNPNLALIVEDEIAEDQLQFIQTEIRNVIDKVWNDIERSKTVARQVVSKKSSTASHKKGWKVVRIFISSTFADFHAEREVVVKKVMPELKEWSEQFKIHILECDLRWGVPKNTDTEETISICLDEITQCISETNGEPFLVSLLSERYGWIPSLQNLSQNIIETYSWVYPVSITHMEIIHAAIRTCSPNALFMLRDKESLNDLPDDFHHAYIDNSILSRRCLERLKQELVEQFPEQTLKYNSVVAGTSDVTGLKKVEFDKLDVFAADVINFFKERIKKYVSVDNQVTEELSEVEKMQEMQDIFIEKRGQLLIGREKEFQAITDFVQSEGREKILFVIAEPGTGKSSLAANYVMKLKENNSPCLYNFASSAPGSTDSITVLQRFCQELSKMLQEDPPNKETLNDYNHLSECFSRQLKDISSKIPGFVIVLDAVNQFADDWGRTCDWLPLFPENVNIRCIITCVPDFQGFDKLTTKFHDFSQKIYLTGFNVECRRELVEILFSRYNKQLDPGQMECLISLDASASPLWLALACEELRVFGVFEQVTKRIKELPDSIVGLLGLIFNRLIAEDETQKLQEAFSYLYLAGSGLTETELRHLLNTNKEECLPMMTWVKTRMKIKPFLLNTGARGDEEMFSFFHNAVAEAVSKHFVTSKDAEIQFRQDLANHFLKYGQDGYRTANAIMKHLQNSNMNTQLVEFFRKDPRGVRISDVQKSFTLKKLRCIQRIMPGNSPFKAEVRMCNRCSFKSKLITQKPLQMKQLCMLCGAFAPWQKPEYKAFLCQKHKPFVPPSTDKCYFCKQVLFLQQKTTMPLYVSCYLCHLCSVGNMCSELTC